MRLWALVIREEMYVYTVDVQTTGAKAQHTGSTYNLIDHSLCA